MAEGQHNDSIRIALIGKTGAGKSSLGNTLLRRRAFISAPGSESVTVTCSMAEGHVASGKVIHVVDTPGIMDTKIENVEHEVIKSIAFLSPGPHAFLLVLNPNRATKEEIDSLTELQNLFGTDTFLRNTILIMVRRDEIENDDGSLMDIHKFIAMRTCKEVQELYEKCGKRIIAVDNKGSSDEIKEAFIEQLLETINTFECYFSHDYFQMVLQNQELQSLLEKEREMKHIEHEEVKRLNEQIEKEKKLKLNEINQLKEETVKQQNENRIDYQKEKEQREKDIKEHMEKLEHAINKFQILIIEQNNKKCIIS